jgi:hypothetical protein
MPRYKQPIDAHHHSGGRASAVVDPDQLSLKFLEFVTIGKRNAVNLYYNPNYNNKIPAK